MGTEKKNQLTLKNWSQEVAECQSSGMTVSAWCELHGINVKTYPEECKHASHILRDCRLKMSFHLSYCLY